ncbi:hypothetical protein Tco_0645209 [Tanacetum coccineum]
MPVIATFPSLEWKPHSSSMVTTHRLRIEFPNSSDLESSVGSGQMQRRDSNRLDAISWLSFKENTLIGMFIMCTIATVLCDRGMCNHRGREDSERTPLHTRQGSDLIEECGGDGLTQEGLNLRGYEPIHSLYERYTAQLQMSLYIWKFLTGGRVERRGHWDNKEDSHLDWITIATSMNLESGVLDGSWYHSSGETMWYLDRHFTTTLHPPPMKNTFIYCGATRL